ncbi:MAG TPA: FHA domain-containing protein [Planctomycetota bacterium]|nr:FHA domain-containing protein [Planctomycetota bacterium]
MPRLVITKGPGTGRDHAVGTECVIGRSTDADFVVEDVGVSRRHCRVLVGDGGYHVEDLGSRNGTFVNGARVAQRQSLSDGAVLRVGETEIVFRQKSMLESPAPPHAAAAVPPAVAKPSVAAAPASEPERPKFDVKPRRRRPGW